MRVSQFEIYRLIQRSMEALGAGYGVDRDAARFVSWLEARGLPGLVMFEQQLARLEAGLPVPRIEHQSEAEIDVVLDGAAIACAGALLDLAAGRARQSGAVQLRLRGCRAPLYLIPAAAEADIPLSLTWPTALGEVGAVMAQGNVTLFSRQGVKIDAALLAEATGDVLLRAIGKTVPRRTGLGVALTADMLRQRLDGSFSAGVAVDPALWQRIDRVAGRVQVPATTVSRERGAGGGDANI
jgi:hypothetical protein